MDRFLSNFTNRLDAKGRISIPASYRAALAHGGFSGLFLHPSLDLPALDCGGAALLAEIDRLLEGLPPYSVERDSLSTALLGVSELLKVDGEGRVVLTESLRAYAGISDEATFVGQGSKFQIWEPERFRAHLAASRESLRAYRRTLSVAETEA
jgi:transcriptional regulator MraZ